MKDDLWKYVAWVKRGGNRTKIFLAIDKPLMPSEIVIKVFGKNSNTYFTLVSRALAELKKKNMVVIKNPEEKTGRIYELSDLGKRIAQEIKK